MFSRGHRVRASAIALAALAMLGATATPAIARADDEVQWRSEVPRLRYEPKVDVPVTFGAGVVSAAMELFKSDIAPTTCAWCGVGAIDNGVRDALVWKDATSANGLSNLIAWGVVPVTTLGLTAVSAVPQGGIQMWAVDALVIAEPAAVALLAAQLTKFSTARQRPNAHFAGEGGQGVAGEGADFVPSADDNLSFFSGHTTVAFALATAAGTVATMRKYTLAPLVWGAGMTLATATGYLRIAADRHYVSDVIVGAAVGAGLGVAMPWVFHRPTNTERTTGFMVVPTATGASATFFGHW